MARSGNAVESRTETRRRPETKTFLASSEFWVGVIATAGVLFAGYVIDDIANATAWRYGTWIAIAYILSRGIAKAGSQRAYDPGYSSPMARRGSSVRGADASGVNESSSQSERMNG